MEEAPYGLNHSIKKGTWSCKAGAETSRWIVLSTCKRTGVWRPVEQIGVSLDDAWERDRRLCLGKQVGPASWREGRIPSGDGEREK